MVGYHINVCKLIQFLISLHHAQGVTRWLRHLFVVSVTMSPMLEFGRLAPV
jgi:hypothetical protein